MTYIWGIFIALTADSIMSIANLLDGKLSRVTFNSVWSLVLINGLLNALISPILYLVLQPQWLSFEQLGILILISGIEVFYQIPYYKALREADTSVIMSLFNLEKIAIPILAYFVVNERLVFSQYLGFALIILCSLMTTITVKMKFNKALLYMILVCAVLAVQSVTEKHALNTLEWGTFYFWMMIVSLPFYVIIPFFSRSARREVSAFIAAPLQNQYFALYGQNLATWISNGLGTLALSILPVTINEGVESLHGVIVYLIAIVGHKHLQLDKSEIFSWQRIFLFITISIGAFLIIARP